MDARPDIPTCPVCGSTRLVIDGGRTRTTLVRSDYRRRLRRQYLRCAACGRRQRRTLRIEETLLDVSVDGMPSAGDD